MFPSHDRALDRMQKIPRRSLSTVAISTQIEKASSFTKQKGVPTLAGFPTKKYVTLRYCDELSLTGGVVTSHHVFRANSLFDPDYTGVGHQPRGFDQWKLIYNRYNVRRARMTVTYVADGTAALTPGAVTLWASNLHNDYSTSLASAMERSDYGKYEIFGDIHGRNGKKKLTIEVDIAKMRGVKNVENEDDLGAVISSSPADAVFMGIDLHTVNGNTTSNIPVTVEIEYDCVFSDPLNLGQS